MKRTAIFLAGATFTLAALGAQVNSEAEERYRAKYGRYTQAHELRENVSSKLEAPACCRNINALFKNQAPEGFAEALFRGKYGRGTPRVEAHEKLAVEAIATDVRTCVERGNCALMQAQGRSITAPKGAAADLARDEFYRAKYGRALETIRREVHVSAATVGCEHECCRRSD